MELNDVIRIPLARAAVMDALHDTAFVRASMAHCESLRRLGAGEYALTLTVPLGPLRGRYEVRAHISAETAQMPARRVVSFRARADGIGALRGQIDVTVRDDEGAPDSAARNLAGTRIDYSLWTTLSGPLAELPPRQIESALREIVNDFFGEFRAIVEAKHGTAPNRVTRDAPRRTHVFLRPISLAGMARRSRTAPHHEGAAPGGRTAGALRSESSPHAMPTWAWGVLIFFVALLFYMARRFTGA